MGVKTGVKGARPVPAFNFTDGRGTSDKGKNPQQSSAGVVPMLNGVRQRVGFDTIGLKVRVPLSNAVNLFVINSG